MSALERRLVNGRTHSLRVAAHAERLLAQVPLKPEDQLLDVGCGNGVAAAHVAEVFDLDAIGVDADPAQIDAAALLANERVHFRVADARDLPFRDGAFDVVFSNKTTHHVRGWPLAFAEIARVLAPGGHLVWSDLVVPIGTRFPTRRAVNSVLAEHALEIVKRSGSGAHYAVIARLTAR